MGSKSSSYKPISTTTSPTTSSPLPTSTSPTTTTLNTNLDYISRAKSSLYNHLSSRRPWRQIFNLHSLSIPSPLSSSFSRLKTNLPYFRLNFAIIVLLILFLSLLWHPLSLIVFLLMMVAWIFLFFLRDHPLLLFRKTIDDRIVLAVLSLLTVGFLLFTGATLNIIVSVSVGIALVIIYSLFRKTDDLYLDEDQAVESGLLSSGRV